MGQLDRNLFGELAAVLTLQVANVNRTLTSFSIGAVIVSGTKLMIGSSLNLEAVSIDLDLPLGQYLLDNIILLTISSSPSLDGFFIRWVDLLDRNLFGEPSNIPQGTRRSWSTIASCPNSLVEDRSSLHLHL